MRVPKRIREEYEKLLKDVGEAKFYEHVLESGFSIKRHITMPEVKMLEQSNDFFSLYRTTGNNNYFRIGIILRRVAHKLYRDSFYADPKRPVDRRFLNIVKCDGYN
jgi:hypothetical protein